MLRNRAQRLRLLCRAMHRSCLFMCASKARHDALAIKSPVPTHSRCEGLTHGEINTW